MITRGPLPGKRRSRVAAPLSSHILPPDDRSRPGRPEATNRPAATSGPPPGPAQDGIARNTGFAFLAQITTALFTSVLTIYLVRALGPEQFGLFSLALAVGGMAMTLADFGIRRRQRGFWPSAAATRTLCPMCSQARFGSSW